MRPIKFRGRKTDNSGEFVFGDLAQFKTNILPANHYFILHNGYQDEVEPDTVAQLVGYDANGKEVYEGDTVIWNDLPMTAKFITNISGGEVLKEADQ